MTPKLAWLVVFASLTGCNGGRFKATFNDGRTWEFYATGCNKYDGMLVCYDATGSSIFRSLWDDVKSLEKLK